jgi:hypothetical protein
MRSVRAATECCDPAAGRGLRSVAGTAMQPASAHASAERDLLRDAAMQDKYEKTGKEPSPQSCARKKSFFA